MHDAVGALGQGVRTGHGEQVAGDAIVGQPRIVVFGTERKVRLTTRKMAHRTSREIPPRPFADLPHLNQKVKMLYTLAVVLIILWLLGMATSVVAGGLIHILLVIAIVVVLLRVISGRRVL